jgi:hypothetical protein
VHIDDLGAGSQLSRTDRFLITPVISPNWPAAGSRLYFGAGSRYTEFDIFEATWMVVGDLNSNGQFDGADIDLLSRAIRDGETDRQYDMNRDGHVNTDDRTAWIHGAEIAHTYFGDSNLDGEFNSGDLVAVLEAGKFATGQSAGWNQGDWNGDARFDRDDIILALQDGGYGQGSLAATQPNGIQGDGQASVIYDASSGEFSLDALAGVELTSINIDSAAGIFTGDPAVQLGGRFDNDADNNIFKATFGGSFGSLSFGNITQAGLTEEFVLDDLTIIGSLAGGGDLGNVDLVYVPEPTSAMLLCVGLAIGLVHFRRANR